MVKSGYRGVIPFVMHQHAEPGERWSGTFEHHLLSITLDGGADYRLPDGTTEVRSGELLYFAPGAWQDWEAITPDGWTVYYAIVDLPTPLQELLPPDNLAPGFGHARFSGNTFTSAKNAFTEMFAWGGRRTAMSDRLILNQLEYVLLLIRNSFPLAMIDERIERARGFLHDRLETPTTLDEVARATCLSKSRLCALFKEITGMSPLQYLEELRMDRAGQLLQFSQFTVDEIAEHLCYSDRKYFDKRFKRRWGVTPYRYRKQSYSGRFDSV